MLDFEELMELKAGSRASITLTGVKDDITQSEVSAAMDVIISNNIFQSSSGDHTQSISILVNKLAYRCNSY